MRRPLLSPLLALFLLLFPATPLPGQISREERNRAKEMLERAKEELEDEYWDTTFGGMDLDSAYQAARQGIEDADQLGQALTIIAQFMVDLDDSHTYFLPPLTRQVVDYGFEMGFVGDTLFVTQVDPESPAHEAGLRPGDAIVEVGPYQPSRKSLWMIEYIYYVLYPRAKVSLIVRTPDGEQLPRQFETQTWELPLRLTDRELERIFRVHGEFEGEEEAHIYVETEAGVMLWQMPSFYSGKRVIEKLIKKVRKHRALILDLRDNPGGPIDILRRLVGAFVDPETVIGTEVSQDGPEDLTPIPWKGGPYEGDLVVLVNGNSGSSAELFARTMQLEKRGVVIGDRTKGEVMASRLETHRVGFGREWRYGFSISVSDLILPDGSRLERVGVTPDEIVLPTSADLRADRDPALARALELVGMDVDPATAGKIFDRESDE